MTRFSEQALRKVERAVRDAEEGGEDAGGTVPQVVHNPPPMLLAHVTGVNGSDATLFTGRLTRRASKTTWEDGEADVFFRTVEPGGTVAVPGYYACRPSHGENTSGGVGDTRDVYLLLPNPPTIAIAVPIGATSPVWHLEAPCQANLLTGGVLSSFTVTLYGMAHAQNLTQYFQNGAGYPCIIAPDLAIEPGDSFAYRSLVPGLAWMYGLGTYGNTAAGLGANHQKIAGNKVFIDRFPYDGPPLRAQNSETSGCAIGLSATANSAVISTLLLDGAGNSIIGGYGSLVIGPTGAGEVTCILTNTGTAFAARYAIQEGASLYTGASNTVAGLVFKGGIFTGGTFTLPNTAVTPGAYTLGGFTVDAQGRLTAAASYTPGTAPADPTGGAVVDDECRTALIALIDVLVTKGILV